MKILKISMLALGTSLCGVAQADVVGVKADASFWNYDGQANMAAQTSMDDQDLDRKGSAQISVAVEHPVPLIPNALLKTQCPCSFFAPNQCRVRLIKFLLNQPLIQKFL